MSMFLDVAGDISPWTIGFGILFAVVVFWLCLPARTTKNGKPLPPVVSSTPILPIPVIGVLVEFLKSPNDMMTRCVRDFGSVFTIPLFHQRLTFLIGPKPQELFFKANDDELSQDECYHFMQAIFGPGVVYDAPKKKRQMQFQTMANGLRTARMKTYVGKIQRETEQYAKEKMPGDSGVIDLYQALSELTILTASRCLHGDDVREHMFADLQKLYHDLDEGLTPLTVLWSTAPTAKHARRNAARKELVELFGKVIEQRRAGKTSGDGTDILSLFMEMQYKDGTKITKEEVTGLLIALLFAGQHTSCTTSTWTALYLITNKDILQRVLDQHEEITKSETELTLEHVHQMELLHNCTREALRMCPTFIMLLRKALKDVTVNDGKTTYTIPKGDLVVVSPTVSMRLDSTFPIADKFDPDRFAAPREEHKQPYAYLGFGGGMHSCMGQVFAYLQVKTILAVLFRDYELELVSNKFPDIGYNDMVVGPKGDCRVKYTKRQTKAAKK